MDFNELLKKRPEISRETLEKDLKHYYHPFIERLKEVKKIKSPKQGLIVGVSAIQGAGKTTQGEIMDELIKKEGLSSVSLSIDDHYITHQELNELRSKDPRFIRRGVTHDISLAVQNLTELKQMKDGDSVKVPVYDKGAWNGDGDRVGYRTISKRADFIFYDGWMLGAEREDDESAFESGLPALDSSEHIQFAKDVNRKLNEYAPLWELIDFMNVLYVPNYRVSLEWRDQAEEALRKQGRGMNREQIREFVYYFWRSVHPAIQIKSLSRNSRKTDQVVIINDDHSIKEVITPQEIANRYP